MDNTQPTSPEQNSATYVHVHLPCPKCEPNSCQYECEHTPKTSMTVTANFGDTNTKPSISGELTQAKLDGLRAEMNKVTEHCDYHNVDYVGGCQFCPLQAVTSPSREELREHLACHAVNIYQAYTTSYELYARQVAESLGIKKYVDSYATNPRKEIEG